MTFNVTCFTCCRANLPECQDERVAQLDAQLPLRQHCGNKKSQYLGGFQICFHSSAPPAITHPSRGVLPSSSDFYLVNCTWSSLMLYFLYAWPLLLLALLFSYECRLLDVTCLSNACCVCVSACVPLLLNAKSSKVFLMPSALYGFLFLSDCTHGSYRDGSHAMRWKHSALDQGSPHLTDKCLRTSTYWGNACSYMSINACTHPGGHESVRLSYIQKHGYIFIYASAFMWSTFTFTVSGQKRSLGPSSTCSELA